MNVLTTPKTKYMLEASLEVLHQESNEWLSEIEFWRDEAFFFYTLIVSKTGLSVPVTSRELSKKIEKELLSITHNELDALYEEVKAHESFLGSLVASSLPNQGDYRERHKALQGKFTRFTARFREVKKDVFELAKLMGRD